MEVYDLCREKFRIYRGFSNNLSQGNIGNLGSHEEVVLDHVMFFLGDAIACALALASDFRLDRLY